METGRQRARLGFCHCRQGNVVFDIYAGSILRTLCSYNVVQQYLFRIYAFRLSAIKIEKLEQVHRAETGRQRARLGFCQRCKSTNFTTVLSERIFVQE